MYHQTWLNLCFKMELAQISTIVATKLKWQKKNFLAFGIWNRVFLTLFNSITSALITTLQFSMNQTRSVSINLKLIKGKAMTFGVFKFIYFFLTFKARSRKEKRLEFLISLRMVSLIWLTQIVSTWKFKLCQRLSQSKKSTKSFYWV